MDKIVLQKRLYFVAGIILILVGLFFVWQFSTKQSAIKRANILLQEYKTAKALEILNQARGMQTGKDSNLDFLYFYALVKSNRFDEAKKVVEGAKPFSPEYKDEILELINLISTKGQTELLIKTLPKAQKISLNQQTLIKLSKERNSIEEEMKFLEASYEFLKQSQKKKKADQLRTIEDYLLNRYMDTSRILIGNQDYSKALEYLRKAAKISFLETSTYKDDYHLNLGLAYRGLGDNAKAFDNFKISANHGNSYAKDIINQISHKYVPPSEVIKKKEEESSSSIREIEFDITEEEN